MKNTIKVRNISAEICDVFEELLDRFDITIPSNDRTGEETEARIFGEPYVELEDAVTDILSHFCIEIQSNPGIDINTTEY